MRTITLTLTEAQYRALQHAAALYDSYLEQDAPDPRLAGIERATLDRASQRLWAAWNRR